MLLYESWAFFQHVPLSIFLTDTVWTPLFATRATGFSRFCVALCSAPSSRSASPRPLGLAAAIYLSEFASPDIREVVKPTLELLSGVPTVVFGFFALLFVTPLLQKPFSPPSRLQHSERRHCHGHHDHSLCGFPERGCDARGAKRLSRRVAGDRRNPLETAFRVVLPAAISGVAAAFVLGISRAVGETMVVAIAAGQQPNLTLDPREPAATITAYIVQVALGDLPHGSIGYQSIFAAGLTLF